LVLRSVTESCRCLLCVFRAPLHLLGLLEQHHPGRELALDLRPHGWAPSASTSRQHGLARALTGHLGTRCHPSAVWRSSVLLPPTYARSCTLGDVISLGFCPPPVRGRCRASSSVGRLHASIRPGGRRICSPPVRAGFMILPVRPGRHSPGPSGLCPPGPSIASPAGLCSGAPPPPPRTIVLRCRRRLATSLLLPFCVTAAAAATHRTFVQVHPGGHHRCTSSLGSSGKSVTPVPRTLLETLPGRPKHGTEPSSANYLGATALPHTQTSGRTRPSSARHHGLLHLDIGGPPWRAKKTRCITRTVVAQLGRMHQTWRQRIP
jgi:hypothetical protein